MKRYLKELELAGILMLFLGVVVGHAANMNVGAMMAAIGLLLWVLTVVVKAFNWQQYRRDNLINIFVMLGAIVMLFVGVLFMKR